MTQEEIRTALAEESDRVEWKQSSADVGEMLRTVGALANDLGDSRESFDRRLVPAACLEDLNLAYLRAVCFSARDAGRIPEALPEIEGWLTAKNLGRSSGGRWVPNGAAILLFGVSPQTFFPGATVEFVRYAGRDCDAPVVLRRMATGTLSDQLDALWLQLSANLVSVPATAEGIRTPYYPEYPIEALRELARNLVQHRLYEGTDAPGRIEWFADRAVFSNPGGLFSQADQGEFGSHADYRNPFLTRWLIELGRVEQLGRGIRLAQRRLAENGNPPLAAETGGFTQVTVRRRE